MEVLVALVFIINGQIDESKTVYYSDIPTCMWYAQEYSRDTWRYFEPTKCVCRLAWVTKGTVEVIE